MNEQLDTGDSNARKSYSRSIVDTIEVGNQTIRIIGNRDVLQAVIAGKQTGPVGWRRSADDPLLCPFSLLTGNFTGNFAKSRLRERRRLKIVAPRQGVRRKFPTQRNRE